MRAAGYLRLSHDPTGRAAGIERQRVDVVALCDRHGWDLTATYVDGDHSAYSGAPRPGWDALWQSVAAGEVDVIVAWHPDRLYRRLRDLVTVTDRVAASGVRIATVTAGEVDLASPEGRLVAAIVGAVAEKSSDDTARRVARWHRHRAEQGLPPPTGQRLFGYRRDRVDGTTVWTVDPVEGPVAVEVVDRVAGGDALVAIRDDLNARGISTAPGGRWTTTTLRRWVTSPTVAGLREVDGTYVVGVWPALVDRAAWDAARRALDARAGTGRRTSTRYLLTGVAVCGRCGGPMHGHYRHGRRTYECRAAREGPGGCSLSIAADPTEAWVRDVVLAAIDRDALARIAAAHAGDDPVVERLAAIDREVDALADDYADGLVDRRAYVAATSRLSDRRDRLSARLTAAAAPRLVRGLPDTPDALTAVWDARSIPWRRSLLRLLVDRVEVAPAPVRGGRWSPERVSFVWRA